MEIIFSVIAFALVSTITPGPNNIMIMTSGVNHGVSKTLPHYLGICFGFPAMLIAVGFGLGSIFIAYPELHKIIKVVGTIYLLYLAWKIAQTTPTQAGQNESVSQPLSFIQAAMFQWVNPKAWVMGVGALATYTTVDGNVNAEVLLIAITFFIVAVPSIAIWLGFGAILQRILNDDKQRRWFNWSMALLLVASVVPMISSLLFVDG